MHLLIRIGLIFGLSAVVVTTATGNEAERITTPLPANNHFTRPLWSIGRINRQPASESGFSVRQAADPVVTIRSPSDVPQIIMPGQSFVIHLGELPETRLLLRLDNIAKRTTASDYGADPMQRRFRILFNGNLLWRRWFIDGHSQIELFVPAPFVRSDGNLLVIENEGKQAVAFHAMSLEQYAAGEEFLAAFTGAQRLDGTTAADVSQAVLRLRPPAATPRGRSGSTNDTDRTTVKVPRDLPEAILAARALAGTSPSSAMPGENAKAIHTEWETAIAASLRRGLLPIVEVRMDTEHQADWEWFAARYGGMVYAWVVSTQTAADAIRRQIEGARIYSLPVIPQEKTEMAGTAVFIERIADIMGGRMDRQTGLLRAESRKGSDIEPAMGVWLRTPPSMQANLMRRRHGEQAAQAMLQWWMSGGDMLILEGGEAGSDFFPDHTGRPSPAWNAVRLIFGIGNGTPRRAACTVIPENGGEALGDSHWVATENSSELVTTLLLPGEDDRERGVRLFVPVPWRGPTEGIVEGVRFGKRGDKDPEPLPARAVRLMAGPPATASSSDGGHVVLGLKLDGLLRVRLWPAGRPPENRHQRLRPIPADTTPPATLAGVFRIHNGPPPAGIRFEFLRQAEWPAGADIGSHTVETRPATRGILPAEAITGDFRPAALSEVRNVVPLDEQSLFITFRPDSAPHAVRLFQAGMHTGGGTPTMMFYIRVRAPATGGQTAGSSQSRQRPLALWMGGVDRRQRLELIPERWHLIRAPFCGFLRPGDDASSFLLWTDGETRHALEVELNGMMAISTTSASGRPLTPVKSAMRRVPDSTDMELLLEGRPGEPAVYRLRFERPVRIRKSAPVVPEKLPGMNVRYQAESQLLELHLDALPTAEDGLSAAGTLSRFPQVRPDPALARVLLRLELEY